MYSSGVHRVPLQKGYFEPSKCRMRSAFHTFPLLCLMLPIRGGAAELNAWTADLGTGVESQYISEGRKQLDAGGLLWAETSLGWQGLTLGVWQAWGTQVNYDESNLWLGYTHSGERLSLGAEIRQIWDRLDGVSSDDQELSLAAGYGLWGPLQADAGATYSFESRGTFLTLGLSCPIACGPENRSTLTPFVLQSFDLGYASDAYDGPNNLEFGIAFTQPLGAGFSLEAACHSSCAHHDVHREGSGDETWVSLALRWTR